VLKPDVELSACSFLWFSGPAEKSKTCKCRFFISSSDSMTILKNIFDSDIDEEKSSPISTSQNIF
jgi:hypothetical protein